MSARQQFIELVEQKNGLNLARLALLAVQILRDDSRDARAATTDALAQLDALKNQVRVAGCEASIDRFVEYMGSDLGFTGNAEDYYASNNSDLSNVLEQRSGIPITLAIVYIELGTSLGFDVRGISFPGHFLVGYYRGNSEEAALVDPFAGQLTDRITCLSNLARMQGHALAAGSKLADAFSQQQQAAWFAPASSQQIGLRLLENLKQIYLQSQQMPRALAALELQLLLVPDSAALLTQQRSLLAKLYGNESRPPIH